MRNETKTCALMFMLMVIYRPSCLAHSLSGLVSMVTTAGMVSLAEMERWRAVSERERAREREREGETLELQPLVEWLNGLNALFVACKYRAECC